MKKVNLEKLPEQGVSHDPAIKKKVLINNREIPNLTGFSGAVLKPGQRVEEHAHETMYEVFYICSGRALFTVNGREVEAVPGDCITVEPKEKHAVKNPFDSDASWLYFGVATDQANIG
jgi:quercetin dioxygenase-like cupin family protein